MPMDDDVEVGKANPLNDEALDPTILVEIVDALGRVPPFGRLRVAQAALTFLGVPWQVEKPRSLTNANNVVDVNLSEQVESGPLPRRATIWLSQNDLGESDLQGVFHIAASGVELIAHTIPGRSNRERVRSCYLLAGLKPFVATGESRFSDDSAREICRDLGCYDKANHATYVKSIGNLLVGSKSSSYELTQVGLKAAAELIRELRSLGH